jgi:hypothetical protein
MSTLHAQQRFSWAPSACRGPAGDVVVKVEQENESKQTQGVLQRLR